MLSKKCYHVHQEGKCIAAMSHTSTFEMITETFPAVPGEWDHPGKFTFYVRGLMFEKKLFIYLVWVTYETIIHKNTVEKSENT